MPSPSPPPDSPDRLDPDVLVAPALLARLVHVAEAGSTMDLARARATESHAVLPLAVVADRQTMGRGRRGAGWWQPPGSLAVSLVIETAAFADSAFPQAAWSLACGVAVAESIRRLAPAVATHVRWPNDVEVAGRKLAGILLETAAGGSRVIFGIGVNTTGTAAAAPPALAHRVATLPDLTGTSLDRQPLIAELVPRLFTLLTAMAADPEALAVRYRPLCCLTGRSVTVHVGHERHTGICQGIAADGRLLLDTPAGRLGLASGSLTPPADVWPGKA